MTENDLKARDTIAEQKRHWIRITRVCNNKCLFCLDYEEQDGEIIPQKEILKGLKVGRKKGAARIIISGGEPTVHPKILEIIKKAKKMGYQHVQMITNGRMLAYGNFSSRLKQAGLDEVTLSLHSHKKKEFEKMVGVSGAYEQSMKGLMNALQEGFIVSIDIVINKINYKELEKTINFFIKLGVHEFDLLYLIPFGSAWKNRKKLYFSPVKAKKYLNPVFAMGKRKDLFIWTNRLPATYLEGYEDLIQSPLKIVNEIRGMESGFLKFIQSGKKMDCFGERCKYCFLRDFCSDLSELRDAGILKSKRDPMCLRVKRKKELTYKFRNKLDVYEFLDFFIKYRYSAKSLRCHVCEYDSVCQGVNINEIRYKGFSILNPIKAGLSK